MNDVPHNLFFIRDEQIQNNQILFTGPEFHHIKNVLRKKTGEIIYFTNGKGKSYKAIIEQILHNAMVIKVMEEGTVPRRNKINIDLGIVPLKSGRTDFIIEKGTELGVNKFIFFISKFSVIRSLTPPRIEHFKKIALSAMLQSQQYYLPEIIFVKDIQKEFSNYDLVVVGDRDGKDKVMPGVQNILLVIGPEGGFSPEEIETFLNNKVKFIPFSINRLRSETAALAGIVSILSYYSL
ncbi:MAG: RsmE family RNA methyltransferase [candidate division WOR-3 bacterium]